MASSDFTLIRSPLSLPPHTRVCVQRRSPLPLFQTRTHAFQKSGGLIFYSAEEEEPIKRMLLRAGMKIETMLLLMLCVCVRVQRLSISEAALLSHSGLHFLASEEPQQQQPLSLSLRPQRTHFLKKFLSKQPEPTQPSPKHRPTKPSSSSSSWRQKAEETFPI